MNSLISKIRRHRKTIAIISIVAVLICLPSLALAQTTGEIINDGLKELLQWLRIVMNFIQILLWPALLLIGGLMTNDLLFSGGMQTTLLSVWNGVRDFVNIFFVLVLLGVAIVNIMGINKDEFQIKNFLPKFAIALIAVNFSFLACKVILDVTNLTATAIFALPVDTKILKEYDFNGDEDRMNKFGSDLCGQLAKLEKRTGEAIAKADQGAAQGAAAPPAANTSTVGTESKGSSGEWCFIESDDNSGQKNTAGVRQAVKAQLTSFGQNFFGRMNSRNIALILAVELLHVTELDKVSSDTENLQDLIVNTLFSLTFFIIYATAFIALFLTLIVRIIVLWVTIALSPLMALGITGISTFAKQFWTGGDNSLGDLFIQHALVPIKLAVVMTIGTIMVTKIKHLGSASVMSNDITDLGAVTSNLSTVQDLIVGMGTALFIWMAIWEALKGTKASGFIEQNIKGNIERAAGTIAKMPAYLPIFQVGKGADQTHVGLAALGPMLRQGGPAGFQRREQSRYTNLFAPQSPTASVNKLTEAKNITEHKENFARMGQAAANGEKFDIGKTQGQEIARNITNNPEFQKFWQNPQMNWAGTGFKGYQDFINQLREGKVSNDQIGKLYSQNQQIFAPGPEDVAKNAADAKAAQKRAGMAGNNELNTRVTALENEGRPDSGKSLQLIEDAMQNANQLDITDENSVKNGQFTQPNHLTLANKINRSLETAGFNETDRTNILAEIFDNKGGQNVSTQEAKTLAESVVKGNAQTATPPAGTPTPPPAPPAPPAPAAPEPPAPAPPNPTS